MKHLFFDLDRTLWDFDSNSRATLKEMYEVFDMEAKYGFRESSFISKYEKINRSFWGMYAKGKVDRESLRNDRFFNTLREFGIEDRTLANQLSVHYLDFCPQKSILLEGAKEVLDHFYGKFPMHIISNGFTKTQTIKLKASGLDKYFETVVTSDMAQSQKPSPKIFDMAWQGAGKPDKEVCYYIGDDWNADVRGARQFGFTPIWYSTEERRTKILQVRKLKRLIEILS